MLKFDLNTVNHKEVMAEMRFSDGRTEHLTYATFWGHRSLQEICFQHWIDSKKHISQMFILFKYRVFFQNLFLPHGFLFVTCEHAYTVNLLFMQKGIQMHKKQQNEYRTSNVSKSLTYFKRSCCILDLIIHT